MRSRSDAWFASVNSIASDGEKHSALSAVIKQDGADRHTLTEALKSAARIPSDGEKARFLVESSQFYIEDGAVRRNFFTAVDGIASDARSGACFPQSTSARTKTPPPLNRFFVRPTPLLQTARRPPYWRKLPGQCRLIRD
jgi:hypothetical protein